MVLKWIGFIFIFCFSLYTCDLAFFLFSLTFSNNEPNLKEWTQWTPGVYVARIRILEVAERLANDSSLSFRTSTWQWIIETPTNSKIQAELCHTVKCPGLELWLKTLMGIQTLVIFLNILQVVTSGSQESCCSRLPVCSKQKEQLEEKGKESSREAKLSLRTRAVP